MSTVISSVIRAEKSKSVEVDLEVRRGTQVRDMRRDRWRGGPRGQPLPPGDRIPEGEATTVGTKAITKTQFSCFPGARDRIWRLGVALVKTCYSVDLGETFLR